MDLRFESPAERDSVPAGPLSRIATVPRTLDRRDAVGADAPGLWHSNSVIQIPKDTTLSGRRDRRPRDHGPAQFFVHHQTVPRPVHRVPSYDDGSSQFGPGASLGGGCRA